MGSEIALALIRKSSRRHPEGPPNLSPAMTLQISAWEYAWLKDFEHGMSVEAIAKRDGVAPGRVRFGMKPRPLESEYRGWAIPEPPPRLIPLFPVGLYTPQSPCPHREPIRRGSNLCCMVCLQSGMDDHPALQRDPAKDPRRLPFPFPLPLRGSKRRSLTRPDDNGGSASSLGSSGRAATAKSTASNCPP